MVVCEPDLEKLTIKLNEAEEKIKQFELRHKEKAKVFDEKQTEMFEMFAGIVRNVLDQVESNTEKFYEMTEKIQVAHLENLDKQTTKLLEFLERRTGASSSLRSPLDEIPRRLEDISINTISKEDMKDDPLSEDNRVPIVSGLKVQFEGEEVVHPVNIE